MQCVILAGGLATRLRPLTEALPKMLVPVAGRPFADLQLGWLARGGVDDVVLCLGYRGEQITAYVGDGRAWGLRVSYVDEGDDLRGTAGALRLAIDEDRLAEGFLVLYGDSFLDVEIRDVWAAFRRSGKPALMTYFRNDGQWDRSNTRVDPDGTLRYDKRAPDSAAAAMTHIDYGLLAFRRSLVEEALPAGGRGDLADLQHGLSVRGELAGYEASRRFYEIGTPSGLADLEAQLASRPERVGPKRAPG